MMPKFGETFIANSEFNAAFDLKSFANMDIIYRNYAQLSKSFTAKIQNVPKWF